MRGLRNLGVTGALALVIAAGIFTPAVAKCDVSGEIFYMHANDQRKNVARTDMHGCDLHFITRGKVRFTNANIVSKPANGSLHKIAQLEFRYKPRRGFKGNDAFVLNVCGRTEKGKGCSTLHYDAIVE